MVDIDSEGDEEMDIDAVGVVEAEADGFGVEENEPDMVGVTDRNRLSWNNDRTEGGIHNTTTSTFLTSAPIRRSESEVKLFDVAASRVVFGCTNHIFQFRIGALSTTESNLTHCRG